MAIWDRLGYRPSPEQLTAHLDSARVKLIAGGERAGKSYSAAMELINRCDVPHGLYWIVGPTYELARPEYGYVAAALAEIGAIAGRPTWPSRGQCSLRTRWGTEISTRSADDPVTLAGLAPDGILMCEAAQHSYDVWLRLRGRIAEKRGWLWASGTFEGSRGWYADTFTRWQGDNPEGGRSFSLPSWSNLALYPGGRDDPEIRALEATYPADLFAERFGAVPCVPHTIVFREFAYGLHVGSGANLAQGLPVHLAIDPGYAGAYAVLAIQVVGEIVHVLDEVYVTGATAYDVIDECKRRDWWGLVRDGVIDIAGRQHQGLPSHVEIWREAAGVYLHSNRVGIADGIARLRTFLIDPASRDPRILFAPHCRHTFAEFGNYRYPEVVENRPAREEPIDADNHALKALSYWLYARYGAVTRGDRRSIPGRDPFAVLRVPEGKPSVDIVRRGAGVRFGKTPARRTGGLGFGQHGE